MLYKRKKRKTNPEKERVIEALSKADSKEKLLEIAKEEYISKFLKLDNKKDKEDDKK